MSDFEKEYHIMQIGRLIAKSITTDLTEIEHKELQNWLSEKPEHFRIQQDLLRYLNEQHDRLVTESPEEKAAFLRVKNHIRKQRQVIRLPRRIVPMLAGAAAIMVFLGVSVYFVKLQEKKQQPQVAVTQVDDDIHAGGYRATLQRSDGQTINLSDRQSGILVGDQITYQDGSEVFDPASNGDDISYYVLSTPKGGTYQLTLPDGTNVWLNSASTLTYPNRFEGDERVVELTGEAYFDVTQMTSNGSSSQTPSHSIPFVVNTAYKSVKVLGTEFNVNAYAEDRAMRTTLVTGKIQIDGQVLSPSQSALWKDNTLSINEVINIEEYIAWKNGEFYFSATPLRDVLRQLERWYDIEVIDMSTADEKIHGMINRTHQLSTVLYTLEQVSGLNFEIKGRRLIVRNKVHKKES